MGGPCKPMTAAILHFLNADFCLARVCNTRYATANFVAVPFKFPSMQHGIRECMLYGWCKVD